MSLNVVAPDGKRKSGVRWPKGLKTSAQRRNLASDICSLLDAEEAARSALYDRYRRNQSIFESQEIDRQRDSWEPNYTINITKPRISKSAEKVGETLFSQQPWFLFRHLGNSQRQEQAEECLQWFLDISNFEGTVIKSIIQAKTLGCTIGRTMFVTDEFGLPGSPVQMPFAGPVLEKISPLDFRVWPGEGEPLENSLYHGHVFDMMIADVKAEQYAGRWAPEEEVNVTPSGENTRYSDRPVQSRNKGTSDDASMARLADLVIRWDLSGKGWAPVPYRVIVDRENQQMLYAAEYKSARSWYDVLSFESDDETTLSEISMASDMQALQVILNDVFNDMIANSKAAARPGTLTEGGVGRNRVQKVKPGAIVRVRGLEKAQIVNGTFAGAGAFAQLIPLLLSMADSLSAVGDTVTGGANGATSNTATEENIKFQSFQMSGNADLRAMKQWLFSVVGKMRSMLYEHHDIWSRLYPHIHIERDTLAMPVMVQLGTTAMQDAPQMQMQSAQMLLAMALQMPQLQLPVYEMVKTIVAATRLPYAESLMDEIDQLAEAEEQKKIEREQAIEQLKARLADIQSNGYTSNAGTQGLSIESLLAQNPGLLDGGAEGMLDETGELDGSDEPGTPFPSAG